MRKLLSSKASKDQVDIEKEFSERDNQTDKLYVFIDEELNKSLSLKKNASITVDVDGIEWNLEPASLSRVSSSAALHQSLPMSTAAVQQSSSSEKSDVSIAATTYGQSDLIHQSSMNPSAAHSPPSCEASSAWPSSSSSSFNESVKTTHHHHPVKPAKPPKPLKSPRTDIS